MRQTMPAWRRRRRRLLLRELIILACALALGLGYSLWQSGAYMPSMDGNIYSMLALEDSLLMVLSNGNRNSLVRIDHTGLLLNYADTKNGQAFQYLESDGETVYAILSYEKNGAALQRLVSLSLKNAVMRTEVLTELTSLHGAPPGVQWREIYLVPGGDGALSIKLAGLDKQGRGYVMRAATHHRRADRLSAGAALDFMPHHTGVPDGPVHGGDPRLHTPDGKS